MKFEKKQLLDITFQKFMDLGLGEGNLNILEDIVAQDVVGFGTTIDEKLFGVKELQSLLIRQKEQSAGMDLSWKINTLDIHISADENSAIFTNEIVLYITEDENPIEMYMRFSVVLEYVQNKWIVVHWHGSKPEHVESEKDTWGIQTWKEKAESLEKEVAERTADLVEKNKELSIEAALEKVRSVAMGMKKPEDMLDVCRVISDQLQQFGVSKIRNVQTAIIDENIGQYLCYQFFPAYDQTTIEDTDYHKSPVEQEMVREMLASRDGHFIGSLIGERLEEFRSHRKEENHFPDPLLDETSEVSYCFLSIGEGGLGMSLYQAMDEGILTLFKRFHQVFSLAYQRFRDIQKAEAQEREAQIEVAVERVRSQSMAMQRPDDLDKVNKEILTQLNWLRIAGLSGVTFYLVDQDGWVKAWDFSSPGNIGKQNSYTLQFDFKKYEMMGYPFKIFEQTDLNYLVADYPLEKLEKAVLELEEIIPEVATVVKDALAKGILTHQWSACARISDGILGIDLVSPPTEDTKTIVLKIAGAFNQAYQRFLDLQKAEAHARESEIDLALERVRAQTMAMHSSEDVGKCIIKMFSELTALGVDEGTRFGIGILNHDNENNQLWTARKEGEEVKMHIGNLDMSWHPLLISARKAWMAQIPFHKYVLEGEDLLDYYRMLNTAPDYKIQIPLEKLPKKEIQHCFIFEHGFFYAFSPHEFQPELIHITKRFSSQFAQTYQRYLDLVGAEAQVREAEIELALERVRARTMAMHHTEELKEVIQVVFDQFVGLNIHVEHAGFILDYKEREDMHIWLADHHQGVPTEITIPYFDSPHWNSYLEAKARQESFFTNLLPLELKNKFYRDLFEWIPELTEEAQQAIFSKPGLAISTVLLDNVGLYIEHYSEAPFSAEENKILMRFGKVFQQTYTRFLDLQKAETQAREALIETALEKVRSRSLAMHKSDELKEVVAILFDKLKELQIPFTAIGIGIYIEGSKDLDTYVCGENEAGLVITNYRLPYFNNQIPKDLTNAFEKQLDFFVGHYSKEEKDTFYSYVLENIPEFMHLPEDIKHMIFDSPTYTISMVAVKNAVFNINDFEGKVLAESEIDIIKRFARVFDQAYTRFLDLQKAEAQAKEAQIEAALERVRSRSLAMHHSSELSSVVDTLLREFTGLEFTLTFCIINLIDEQDMSNTVWAANPETGKDPESYYMKFEDYPFHHAMWDAWKAQKKRFVYTIEGKEKKIYDEYLYSETEFRRFPEQVKEANKALDRYVAGFTFFKYSGLQTVSLNPISEDELEILERFGKVFEQSYTRFLDLQNAEAQTRESLIQLALERVRARTMAMQHSDELPEAANLLFQQVQSLGMPAWSAGYCTWNDDEKRAITLWMSSEGVLQPPFTVPTTKDELFIEMRKGQEDGKAFHVVEMGGKKLVKHYQYMRTLPVVGKILDSIMEAGHPLPTFQIMHHAYFSKGFLLFITYESVPDAHSIFQRFGKVFDQTYTRFLDLQKAEAQAREAQIEAALERVRSKTMAMHNSMEVGESVATLFEELSTLGLLGVNDRCGIGIMQPNEIMEAWTAAKTPDGKAELTIGLINMKLHPMMVSAYGGWFEKKEINQYILEGEDKLRYYDAIRNQSDYKIKRDYFSNQLRIVHTDFYFNEGCLYVFSQDEISSNSIAVFLRFVNVFGQTYRRYLDLRKAEAQAKEAEIQLALERVRARSLAMHRSEELADLSLELVKQVQTLGMESWFCAFNIYDNDPRGSVEWGSNGKGTFPQYRTPREGVFLQYFEAGQRGETLLVNKIGEEACPAHYEYLCTLPGVGEQLLQMKAAGIPFPTSQIDHVAFFKYGYILFITYEPAPESHDIFKRFANVFEQSYTRFLDLKRAEEQTREAKVEAALEKVRSRSLAMQSPDELIEVAQLLREEMGALGVEELETSSIYIHNDDSDKTQCWFTIKDSENPTKAITDQMTLNLHDTWVGRKMLDFYHSPSNQTSILMQGDQRIEWIRYCEEKSDLFGTSNFYGETIPDRTYHLYKFSNGYIGAAAPGPISMESWELLKRATAVFSFAYTRFRSLQMAEASARAAMRQASLDRVRAEISSMRNTNDLERITPLVFHELTTLSIPFIRCGVFIVDEKRESVEVYLSTPEGKSLAVMTLPYGANDMTTQSVKAWKNEKVYIQHWDKADFINWSKSLQEQGYVQDVKTYQGGESAPQSLHLHFIPFNQGLLYVGSTRILTEEQIDLVKALAKSFAIAYARYEDFVKLEHAKAEVDMAIKELKSTQAQLIQSEKMASLGELTAGIAHEIQNPLNFVNNFSELSNELISELKVESLKVESERDKGLEDELLNDIAQNLTKINHHGKRASDIVKGMLEHSRNSTGQKELTDINALCGDYLRLAYQGLKAKNKDFNATMETHFDTNLPKVDIIPQDMGRVLLNLINNAFYAVSEKSKVETSKERSRPSGSEKSGSDYVPTVSITTLLTANSQLLISIKDNGSGIPEAIKDKIFQPFFTTKPTGQGTGLGLSLSYDIVKAHGGELKVETKEGEGSEFIIHLLIS
jgi:signal transduction histidine kinase/DNA-directed RNA polymerase subunit N (RpoN/RPB10)